MAAKCLLREIIRQTARPPSLSLAVSTAPPWPNAIALPCPVVQPTDRPHALISLSLRVIVIPDEERIDALIVGHGSFLLGVRVRVKVRRVVSTVHLGDNRPRQAPVQQHLPFQIGEPFVLFDVLHAVCSAAIPLGEIRHQYLLQQRLHVVLHVPREVELTVENLLVDAHRVLIHKRRLARQHLIGQNTKSPPVHALTVALVQEHLRRNVLRGAAQGVRFERHHLGEAEVRDFKVARRVEEQVFRFKIAVNHVRLVQVFKNRHHTRRVELSRGVVEAARFAEMRE
mmetsp:Transcript_102295/g.292819  ORF Transcript_102295/g.292819 Transcript_102295/m.292819 type:complete len:284 (+) Transcript_102295:3646-4497(+)